MRKIAGIVGVVSVSALIIFSVRGNEEAKMREIIARAIQAHGGAENLQKFQGSISKSQGKLLDLEYTTETSVQMPDCSRTVALSKLGSFVQVLNGEQGWLKFGELCKECNKEELAELKEQLNATRISHLTVLSDKEYKLSPMGEEQIDDKAAVGIRVEHKSFRDVCLYFDKETGLLVKMQSRFKDPLRGGEEISAETFYGDYKDVEGVMTAHKVTIKYDGKLYTEAAVKEVKLAEKLDEGTFGRP